MLPLVSIVINNYNYGRFLAGAIDSALAQTYPNTEVVVVDDGSMDNSGEVIAAYGDRIVPVLKENGGQGSALNAGFVASRGEFVLFLDSDDMLEVGAIETAVGAWRDRAARIFFRLRTVDESGSLLPEVLGGEMSGSGILSGPFVVGASTSGNVFSREVLEKIMPIPDEDWRICADTYLCAATSLFGEAVSLVQPLARYRIHGKNNFQGAEHSLARTRRSIEFNLRLHSALFRLASGKIGSLDHWLGAYPEHWMRRITSLRESPDDHPWPDTLPGLTVRAVKAAWRRPCWSFHQRLSFTLYAAGYGLLPGKALGGLRKAWRKFRGRERGRTAKGVVGA